MSQYTQLRNNRIRKARKALYYLDGIRHAQGFPLIDNLFATADRDVDLGLDPGKYWPAKKPLPTFNARDASTVLLTAMPAANAEKLKGHAFRTLHGGGHFWRNPPRSDQKFRRELLDARLSTHLRLFAGRCPDIVTGGLPLAGPTGSGLSERDASIECLFTALDRFGGEETLYVEWKPESWVDRSTFTYSDSFTSAGAFHYNPRNRLCATIYSRAIYFLHACGEVPWKLPVEIDRWDLVHPAIIELFGPQNERHPYLEVQVHGGLVWDDVLAVHDKAGARKRLLETTPE